MEKFCFFCNKKMPDYNFNKEHIIPQALGGKLITKNYCCTKHNNDFGKTIDLALINQFDLICTILNIKRHRMKPPKVNLKTKETNELFVIDSNNKIIRKNPVQKITNNEYKIYYNSEKQLKKYKDNFSKRGKKLSSKKITNGNPGEIHHFPHLLFRFQLGTIESYKALTKIAILYYLHNNGNKHFLSQWLNFYLTTNQNANIVFPFYSKYSPTIDINENNIIHHIYLEGNNQIKLLYVVIILFNTFKYIVLLNRNYIGNNIRAFYTINIINGKKQKKDFDIKLPKNFFNKYFFDNTLLDSEWEKLAKLLAYKLLERQIDLIFATDLYGYKKGTKLTKKIAIELSNKLFTIEKKSM